MSFSKGPHCDLAGELLNHHFSQVRKWQQAPERLTCSNAAGFRQTAGGSSISCCSLGFFLLQTLLPLLTLNLIIKESYLSRG